MALRAKAKAEADYRFYALYDKISRDDILVHADAQRRSSRGAPGVDGQGFADIEAYGVCSDGSANKKYLCQGTAFVGSGLLCVSCPLPVCHADVRAKSDVWLA